MIDIFKIIHFDFNCFSAGPGMSQYSNAVPSDGYAPTYPTQPYPHPHAQGLNNVVITKPIRSVPSVDYGSISHSTIAVPTEIIVVGGCPACRIGMLEDDFTCLGVCCAIFLFPVGILCCLALKNKRCTNCGAQFWKPNSLEIGSNRNKYFIVYLRNHVHYMLLWLSIDIWIAVSFFRINFLRYKPWE